MILGVSVQARVAAVVGGVLLVTWALFLFANWRSRKPQVGADTLRAPNRTFFLSDEELEGRALTRVLTWGFITLVISAVGLPLYGVLESNRQVGEAQKLTNESLRRGEQMWQPTTSPQESGGQPPFGCAGCHGADGSGGNAPFSVTDALGVTSQVSWAAPQINNVNQRFTRDEVRYIMVFGRAGKPMPAWGIAGGGPMSDQQVEDAINYLFATVEEGGIALAPEPALRGVPPVDADGNPVVTAIDDAQARYEKARNALCVTALGEAAIKVNNVDDACPQAEVAGLELPSQGALLFNLNCARCHTKGYSWGDPQRTASGWLGPNLTNGSTLRQFPDQSAMVNFINAGAPLGQAYGTGGSSEGVMPHFGSYLTEDQVQSIVEYVRTL